MRFIKRRTDRSVDARPATIMLIFALLALLALAARVLGQASRAPFDASGLATASQNPIQPFINLNLAGGWAIASARNPITKWDADDEWTIPLGLDVTKEREIDTQPMSLGIQYHGNVVRPAWTGSSQLRLIASFLLPKTASKQPKEVAP